MKGLSARIRLLLSQVVIPRSVFRIHGEYDKFGEPYFLCFQLSYICAVVSLCICLPLLDVCLFFLKNNNKKKKKKSMRRVPA